VIKRSALLGWCNGAPQDFHIKNTIRYAQTLAYSFPEQAFSNPRSARLNFAARRHICEYLYTIKITQYFSRLGMPPVILPRAARKPAHNNGCGPCHKKRLGAHVLTYIWAISDPKQYGRYKQTIKMPALLHYAQWEKRKIGVDALTALKIRACLWSMSKLYQLNVWPSWWHSLPQISINIHLQSW
jgi:hypothetical protein